MQRPVVQFLIDAVGCCYRLVFTSTQQLEGLSIWCAKECMSHLVTHLSTVVHIVVNWDAIDKVEQRVSTDTPLILSWYLQWFSLYSYWQDCFVGSGCRQVWWYTWNLGCTFKGGWFQTLVLAIEGYYFILHHCMNGFDSGLVFSWLCSPPGVTRVAVFYHVIWLMMSWVQTGYYRERILAIVRWTGHRWHCDCTSHTSWRCSWFVSFPWHRYAIKVWKPLYFLL